MDVGGFDVDIFEDLGLSQDVGVALVDSTVVLLIFVLVHGLVVFAQRLGKTVVGRGELTFMIMQMFTV